MQKEAQARIKINKLLEESGWRFLDTAEGKANVQLETGVVFSSLGPDFEQVPKGFIDFLLLDVDGKPLVVVEAKKESIDPLSAKEQARVYARNANARYIILTNGNLHYFWDTIHGNPETISRFPSQESVTQFQTYTPNPSALADMPVDSDYIMRTQIPSYDTDPSYQNEDTRAEYIRTKKLRPLRKYQVDAIHALQKATRKGNNRYLFEMATGTGKTLTSAAVIKLFLRSGNAKRVLFLVDRLELEDQAYKAFVEYMRNDYTTLIYKENMDTWRKAEIVVSTVQTMLSSDRYRKVFSPTDFELVISDEAHRSIGGNSRAVFEYFVGYKLGLTATPKDYLRGFDSEGSNSQREFERRELLSTYRTFGCQPGEPTFSYSLIDGVKDGFLINPSVVDARTEITTELLSEKGYAVHTVSDDGQAIDDTFHGRDFERKFFNQETNIAMCKAFLDNGLLDPIAEKFDKPLFGKSIIFCISQRHAAKVTNILNKLALSKWPGLYDQSNFAVQVTSQVRDAQQMTNQFANNTLLGRSSILEGYDTSKARVAVTVGMMTTGYDCQDILNLALMRPVFSPADFVQIKGRGTRKFQFDYENPDTRTRVAIDKDLFKFFDFFANCEYFEKDFDYNEKLSLPRISKETVADESEKGSSETEYVDENGQKVFRGPVTLNEDDDVKSVKETSVGSSGMRIDRESFRKAIDEDVIGNEKLKTMWENGDAEGAEAYTRTEIFDKPKYFLNLDKVRSMFNIDRRLTMKEFLEFAFNKRDRFAMKDELLDSEWEKFVETHDVDQQHYADAKHFFKAYITDPEIREIIENKQYAELYQSPVMSFEEFERLNGFKTIIPQYVKDYVSLNTFMN